MMHRHVAYRSVISHLLYYIMMHRHVAHRSALNMRLFVTSSSHLHMQTRIVQYPHCYLSHMVTLHLFSSSTRLSLIIVLSPSSLSVSSSSSLIHSFIPNLHLNLYLSYTSPNKWTNIHPQMIAMKGERIFPLLCSALLCSALLTCSKRWRSCRSYDKMRSDCDYMMSLVPHAPSVLL